MRGTFGLVRHLTVAALAGVLVVLPAGRPVAAFAQDSGAASTFVVTLRGVRVGTERVTVSRPNGGFQISITGQSGPPMDLVISKFELTYSGDWQPQHLTVDGAIRNETIGIDTSFGVTTARSEVVQGQRRGGVTHQISPRAVVLPANFFGAFEALAARLSAFQVGSRIPVYVAPEGEITATLNRVTPRRIAVPGASAELQEYDLTLNRPGVPMSVQVLVDTAGRLARVVYRDLAFAAIREEFATVMAREIRIPRDGDTEAFIPAPGFSLAATLSRPKNAALKAPAVVLVGSPGKQDRDETLYGVPVFGHLAGALADAGYIVVRYDKRGSGQSGGRIEHTSLVEYTDDVLAIVTWLRKRSDVDPNRIVLMTHGEGSAIGLTAAGRDRKIRALGLLAAPGLPGRDVVLDQQRQALARRNEPDSDRQAKIALQQRVIEAVITDKGWETLPPDIRRQADSPWFKSWLLFDPAVALKKVNQPLLILHGDLDQQTTPVNGERLAQLSLARKGSQPADTARVLVPGVNHLLVKAGGDLESYDPLAVTTLAPEAIAAIVEWLNAKVK